jgi:hypothetical protein
MSIESKYPNRPRNGKVFAGLILLAVGAVLLLQQVGGFFFPNWLFSMPVYLIVFGAYLGFKNEFRKPGAIIIMAIGVVWLLNNNLPGLHLGRVVWPLAIIGFGFWLITGKNHKWGRKGLDNFNYDNPTNKHDFTNPFDANYKPDPNFDPTGPTADYTNTSGIPPYTGDDHIDTVSVFGGIKRTILSKTFKGGEIVNVFGGTDLDLTQADINGRVEIEIVQLFGGIKLIIPPHWQVTSDVAAVFSSVDDKRRSMGTPLSPDKVLVIKGVSIFAGVDIRSF